MDGERGRRDGRVLSSKSRASPAREWAAMIELGAFLGALVTVVVAARGVSVLLVEVGEQEEFDGGGGPD